MPVFCTQLAVLLQRATARELLIYFNDGEAPDGTARSAMAWLGAHRPAVRDELLCRLFGVTVLEGATAEAARARFVGQLKLLEKFRDTHPDRGEADDESMGLMPA